MKNKQTIYEVTAPEELCLHQQIVTIITLGSIQLYQRRMIEVRCQVNHMYSVHQSTHAHLTHIVTHLAMSCDCRIKLTAGLGVHMMHIGMSFQPFKLFLFLAKQNMKPHDAYISGHCYALFASLSTVRCYRIIEMNHSCWPGSP